MLDLKVDGVHALSPDMTHKFMFEGEGYSLDRPKLAKKLVELAKKSGAEYLHNHEVEGPIVEDDTVVGVYGRDEKNKQYRLRSKLTIDCLGVASTIRRKLPQNKYIENMVSTDDIESTGRYICHFEQTGDDLKLLRSEERADSPEPTARARRIRMGLPQVWRKDKHRPRSREEVPRGQERKAQQEGHASHPDRPVRRMEPANKEHKA